MKKLSLFIAMLLLPAVAQAWPWSQDMANQISTKPQESADPANPGMTPFPKRSVPVPGTANLVADQAAAEKLKNPVAADAKSVETGRQLFQIYCVPCHGKEGHGDGYVGAKLALQPYNLSAQQTRERSDGFIFGYMTFGGAVMPIYANDLSPAERWHVVNYVRKVIQSTKPAADKMSAAK
jgi:mono/diheme cytochrome c family protein